MFKKFFNRYCLISKILNKSSFIMDVKQYKSKNFDGTELLEDTLHTTDPIKLFEHWMTQARNTPSIPLSHAMTISTVQQNGRPSSRIVLLQGFSEKGFKFYTSSFSAKAADLEFNAFASLVFYWMPLNRSVRIEGIVEKVPDEEANIDFVKRSRKSQLSMHVSDEQSKPVKNRFELLEKLQHVSEKYKETDVPRPSYIVGYRVVPDKIEFWQGHNPTLICDRIVFTKTVLDHNKFSIGESGWKFFRLGP